MNEALRLELEADGYNDIKTTIVCPFHVDTKLFKDKVRWNFKSLLPTLSQEFVASEIVRAIENGTSEVWLPSVIMIIPILRFLPTLIYDYIHKVTLYGQQIHPLAIGK